MVDVPFGLVPAGWFFVDLFSCNLFRMKCWKRIYEECSIKQLEGRSIVPPYHESLEGYNNLKVGGIASFIYCTSLDSNRNVFQQEGNSLQVKILLLIQKKERVGIMSTRFPSPLH